MNAERTAASRPRDPSAAGVLSVASSGAPRSTPAPADASAGPVASRPAARSGLTARLGHFLGLIRVSHTLFALPFALLAAAMAWGLDDGPPFTWRELSGILLCMFFARSAAMAFNRMVDARFDAANPRTAGRHIPAGLLTISQVGLFTAIAAAGFFAATLLFWPNWLPLALALPVLAFLCAYSYAKRLTSLVHAWLGAALMLAPICAWIALRGELVIARPTDLAPAAILGGAVLLWVAGFDIIYACQDYEFDRATGLHSLAARLGVAAALRVAAGCHALMLGLLALVPLAYPAFGAVFWSGVGLIALLLAYEHSLVRPDDLSRVNRAFFHVNAVISLGLLAMGALDIWWW